MSSGGSLYNGQVALGSQVSGILPVANGGTGTSTAPSLNQILIGNGSNGYNLVATSTLGFQPAGTYVTSLNCSGSILCGSGASFPSVQLQNLTANDILFGAGNSTLATSSNFQFTGGNTLP